MVSTIGNRERTVAPAWPGHGEAADRDGDGVVDLRDDRTRAHAEPVERVEEPVVRRRRGARVLHALGWLVAAAILAAVTVVAVANRSDEVAIDFVSGVERIPMWSVIGGAALAGFLAGRFMDSSRC